MISKEEALIILKRYIQNKEIISKSILVESIMRDLAKRLNRDENLWGLTGLLYNVDYEYTVENLEERGNLSSKILTGLLPKDGINAIKGLNYTHTDYLPTRLFDKALIATVSLTDLLFEILRCYSTEEISKFNVSLFYKKYKDESFAPRVERKRIRVIVDIGFTIEEFFKISANSLNKIFNKIKA